MFFGIFVLNRVSILSFFVLIRVSIFIIINFCLKQGIFLNSFVIANGLNLEFRYLLLSYTGYGFGLNVLNRASKIGILDLKQGREIGDFCLKQVRVWGAGRTPIPVSFWCRHEKLSGTVRTAAQQNWNKGVYTHRTPCQSGWSWCFGALNPNHHFWVQSTLLVRSLLLSDHFP